jgi:hypothetical protein
LISKRARSDSNTRPTDSKSESKAFYHPPENTGEFHINQQWRGFQRFTAFSMFIQWTIRKRFHVTHEVTHGIKHPEITQTEKTNPPAMPNPHGWGYNFYKMQIILAQNEI